MKEGEGALAWKGDGRKSGQGGLHAKEEIDRFRTFLICLFNNIQEDIEARNESKQDGRETIWDKGRVNGEKTQLIN